MLGFWAVSLRNDQQERLRAQFSGLNKGAGLGPFDDHIRQNLAMFDRAMKMFSPFAFNRTEEPVTAKTPPPAAAPPTDDALNDLKKRMEEMAAQIEKLASKN